MKKIPGINDGILLVAERLARQVYWSSPRLRSWLQRRRAGRKPIPQIACREKLKQHLRDIGVREGALVMAHTSVTGLRWEESAPQEAKEGDFLTVASQLLDDLLELVGETGTLVMPTNPYYQLENDYGLSAEPNAPHVYDPKRTPGMVGVANELFWRRRDVQRSLHPFNTLAARGPLAEELLCDNLNEHKPLPHGIYSGYYRFCQHNGLVVSVGVPLCQCLTLAHVAEDVRDQQWPIKDFFVEVPYVVRIDGRDRRVVVRQWDAAYSAFCLCWQKVVRDLVREGVVHEGMVGNVRVDWARAQEVYEYFMARNADSSYPYYWPWLVRKRQKRLVECGPDEELLESLVHAPPRPAPLAVEPPAACRIRQATEADLDAVVRVHLAAFRSESTLAMLGPPVLRKYYQMVLRYPQMIFLVAEIDTEIVGFVAGFVGFNRFYAWLRAHRWQFILPTITTCLRRPRRLGTIISVWRRPLLRRWPNFVDESNAELASIAISPARQNRGFGGELVQAFIEAARSQGTSHILLTTDAVDNETVNLFYVHLGFEFLHTIEAPGQRLMNVYTFLTSTDRPSDTNA